MAKSHRTANDKELIRWDVELDIIGGERMAIIKAYNGEDILIDDEDYELLSKHKWSVTKPGHRRTIYAKTNMMDESSGRYYVVSIHRIILKMAKGDKRIVDHINGDGLDNRKENLRIASRSDNASNVAKFRTNTSGYKGVYFRKDRNVWSVEIRKNRKKQFKKSFKCKHCAANFYNTKALEIHGEFAWLNEVQECGCDAKR